MSFLLLRGLARSARHWGELPRWLRDASGAEVVCLDLPGAGSEVDRASPATVREIADDVRRRFAALRGQGRRWVLTGISLGGMVAMDWCARHPEDFAAVALLNTSSADVAPPWARMRPSVLPRVIASLADGSARSREARILSMTTTRLSPSERETLAEKWAALPRMKRRAALHQILAGARFRAPAKLDLPALVVASGGDELCASMCGARLAERFGATFRVHPDAGHDLATDAPAWTAEVLATWSKPWREGVTSAGRT